MPAREKTLLIDGDLILYRSCAAVEKEICWDGENWTLHSNVDEAFLAVEDTLNKLWERFDTHEHVICLTSSPTFRHALCPTYKGNRAGQRKPVAYTPTRERLEKTYRVVKFPGLEADDVMGIFATREPDTTIVCSQDKDMRCVPCVLWDGKLVAKITEDEADHWHMMQTLTGDTSDGYPGCPKVGPVKAQKLLEQAMQSEDGSANPTVWPYVVEAYKNAGLTEEDALLQARLARILRDSDWDAEKKQPILWSPQN